MKHDSDAETAPPDDHSHWRGVLATAQDATAVNSCIGVNCQTMVTISSELFVKIVVELTDRRGYLVVARQESDLSGIVTMDHTDQFFRVISRTDIGDWREQQRMILGLIPECEYDHAKESLHFYRIVTD